jgi:hypothetical protein
MREKDSSIAALAQFKTEKSKSIGELTTCLQLRDTEISSLKKK